MSVSTTQGTSSLASFDQSSAIARKDLFQTCPREILRLILSMTPQPSQAQVVNSFFRDVMNEVSLNFLFVTFDSSFRSQNPHFFNETDPTLSDEQRAEYKKRNDRIAESFKKHALVFGPYCSRSFTALATFFLQQEMALHRYLVRDDSLFSFQDPTLNPESYLSLVKTNELFLFAEKHNSFCFIKDLFFFLRHLQWFFSENFFIEDVDRFAYPLFFVTPISDSISHFLHHFHNELFESSASSTESLSESLINFHVVLENFDCFRNTLFRLASQLNPQFETLSNAEYTRSLQTALENVLTSSIPLPLLLQAIPPEAYPDISAFLHFMSDPSPRDLEAFIDRLRSPQLQTLCPFLSNHQNRENLLNSFLSLTFQNFMSMLEHDPSPEVHSLLEELKKSFSQKDQRNYSLLMSRPSIPQKKLNKNFLRYISECLREFKTIPRSGLKNIFPPLSIFGINFLFAFSDPKNTPTYISYISSLKDFIIHASRLEPPNDELSTVYTFTPRIPISQYTLEENSRIRTLLAYDSSGFSELLPKIPVLLPPKMPYFWELRQISLAGQKVIPSTFDQLPSGVIINDIFSLNRSTLDRTSTHPALAPLYTRKHI